MLRMTAIIPLVWEHSHQYLDTKLFKMGSYAIDIFYLSHPELSKIPRLILCDHLHEVGASLRKSGQPQYLRAVIIGAGAPLSLQGVGYSLQCFLSLQRGKVLFLKTLRSEFFFYVLVFHSENPPLNTLFHKLVGSQRCRLLSAWENTLKGKV